MKRAFNRKRAIVCTLKKILAVTMSAVLLIGLWPGAAVANDLTAGVSSELIATMRSNGADDAPSSGLSIKQIAVGGAGFVAALMADGSLWMWGYGAEWELCTPENIHRSIPVKVLENVEYVSCGSRHAAAIMKDGSLWTWGTNSLGLGETDKGKYNCPQFGKVMDDVVDVSCGSGTTAAVKSDGSLWTWGVGVSYQLGDGKAENRTTPEKIMENVSAVDMEAGFGGALKADGTLWMWGDNSCGQLGDGTKTSRSLPMQIMTDVSSFSLGSSQVGAIKNDGTLWMWGANNFGQLGNGLYDGDYNDPYSEPITTPQQIMDKVESVECGWHSTAVIKQDDSLWTFGYNDAGQLGIGSFDSLAIVHSVPAHIMDGVSSASLSGFYSYSPGSGVSAAIKSDGTLWTWGNNRYGAIGDGTKTGDVIDGETSIYRSSPRCIFRDGEWLYGSDDATQPTDPANESFKVQSVDFFYNYVKQDKNLLKDVVTLSLENKNTPLSLKVEFAGENTDIGRVQLAYYEAGGIGGRDVPEVIATANDKHEFKGLEVGDFEANRPLSILVYDKNGALRSSAGLALSIRAKSNDLSAEMNFGDGFTFTIKDGVLAGKSLSFGDFKCPITWKVTTDGKLQMGINFDIGSDSVLDQLKKGATLKTSAKALSTAMLKPELGQAFAKSLVNPTFSIVGYAEGSIGSNVMTGRISVKMGASVYQEFQAGLFVGELSGSMAGVATASAQFDSSAGSKEMIKNAALDLGAEGSLGAYGGVGAAYVASVGIYGKATGNVTYRLAPQSQSGLLEAIIKGEMGVKVKALGRNVANIAFVKGEYPLYRRDSNYSLTSMSTASVEANDSIDSNTVYPLVEGGESAAESWAKGASGAPVMRTQSVEGDDVATLASDVYPDATPRLINIDDTVVLFFLDSASGRAEANRSELVYSVLDPSSNTWSVPKAVEDDGTADFGFDVYANGNRIDVVWQDAVGPLSSEDTLEEIAQAIQVSYASIDASTGAVSNAEIVSAAGNGYPLLPRVASDEGSIVVSWVANDAHSVTAAEGNNAVKKATRASSGSSWSVRDVDSLGSSVPTSLDVGLEGSALSVAWSYDLDGDISDASDGHSCSELSGSLADKNSGNVQYALWGDSSVLTYSLDGGIMNAASGEFVIPSGALESQAYELVSVGDAAAIVQSYISADGSQVLVSAYDPSTDTWSAPFPAFECGGVVQYLAAAYLDDALRLVALEAQGSTSESAGVSDLVCMKLSSGALVVRSVEYSGTPQVHDGVVDFVATIANEGVGSLALPVVEVLDESGDTVASATYNGSIGPGMRVDLPISVPIEADGPSVLNYSVAPVGMPASSGVQVEFCPNNLSVSVAQSIENGDESLSICVANEGIDESSASSIEVFNWESGETIDSVSIPAVESGGAYETVYSPGGFLRDLDESSIGIRLVCEDGQASTMDDVVPIAPWDGDAIAQEQYGADDSPWMFADTPIANSFVYDGEEHIGVASGVGYSLSGTVSATEVGTYTATATLLDGYEWEDGTSASIELTWRIGVSEAAGSVVEIIAALPELDALKLTDEGAVSNARIAYDSLSPDDQGLVSNYSMLLAAETQIEALKEVESKEKADRAAAAEVIAAIEILNPVDEISLEDAAAVAAVENMYSALTSEQQGYVTNIEKLRAIQARIVMLQEEKASSDRAAAAGVELAISNLGEITLEDADRVIEVSEAYDSLSDVQKEYVANANVLEAAIQRIDELKAGALAVAQMIAELPEHDLLQISDEEAVVAARMAYDALSPIEQELVDNYGTLCEAEVAIESLKQEAQEALDRKAASEVEQAIADLVDLTLDDAATITAVQWAYNSLTPLQQGLVSNIDQLNEAEARMAELISSASQEDADRASAAQVEMGISLLPAPSDLTLDDAWRVSAMRDNYDLLSESQKALVGNYDVLQAAEAQIAELGGGSSQPGGDGDLAAATVQWGSPIVDFVESGLPDVSGVVQSVQVDGEALSVGTDYQLVVVDGQGSPVDSVPVSDGEYFVRIEGMNDYAGTHCANDIPLTVVDPYYIGTALGVSGWWNAYTGSAHQVPSPAAYTDAGPLWLHTDYEAEFLDADNQPVQPVEPGTYRLVFTGIGSYHGTYEAPYTIADKNDLASASVIVNRVINCTGKVVSPVSVTMMGVPLVEGEDYDITYYDSDSNEYSAVKDPGTYRFVITAGPNGKYQGTYNNYDSFTIVENNEASLSNAVVFVDGMALTAGGTTSIFAGQDGVVPEVVVQLNGETLQQGVDYEFGGWSNYATGATTVLMPSTAYSFTVSAKEGGAYSGSFQGSVSVRNSSSLEYAKVSVSNAAHVMASRVPVFEYTGSAVDVRVNASIDGAQVGASNYQLLFAKCEVNGGHWSSLSPSTVSIVGDFTDEPPLDEGVYCMRLQAVGNQYSGTWRTNPGDYTPLYLWVGDYYDIRFATLYTYTSMPYSGEAVHPSLKLMHDGRLLVEGEDFEITGYTRVGSDEAAEPIEQGAYQAEIRGIGRYSGTNSVSFSVIEPVLGNISNAVVDYDSNVPYTGSAAYPTLTVTLDGDPLVEGVDYEVVSAGSGSASDVQPVTIGYYSMTLKGVEERGVSGTRIVSYNIVNPQSMSSATVEGVDQRYQYTGSAVNPKPTAVRMGDAALVEGTDYEVEYYRWEQIESRDGSVTSRQVLTSSCVDEGRYEMHVVGYGTYSGYATKSFSVVKPSHNLSEATVYTVRDGERVPLQESYEYTGDDVLGNEFEVWLDGTKLDPSDYMIRIHNGDYVVDPVFPGKYYVNVVPMNNVYPQTGVFNFNITVPTRTENGVIAAGELFVDKADEAANTEVLLTVEQKGDDAAPATKRVAESCEEAGGAFVGVTDVRLNVVKSDTSEVVESITEDFGELALAFPVDAQYNGTAARVIQVHKDAETGVVRTIEHPLTRVVDGRVGVTVDRLSEFVVVAGTSAATLDVDSIVAVAKPTATDFNFDGEEHVGVVEGAGYVLTGTAKATAAGTYTVTAILEDGYEWEDGSTDPIALMWKIANASGGDPIDLTGASIALSSTSYVYDGSAKQPTATVAVGGNAVPSSAYKVSYGNNTNAGTATVTISANAGGYTGQASAQFTIAKRNASIAAKSSSRVYDGNALTASAVGYAASGFVKESDLASVTMSGSVTNVGSATSSIASFKLAAGMDANYNVTTSNGTLTVTAASINTATVTLAQSTYTYDGKAKTPAVTSVKLGGTTLKAGTDYTVSYSNNVNAGIATATVTGKGNYTGTAKATFSIAAFRVTVYRVYDLRTGEHLYTTSRQERDVILGWGGWRDEGIAWVVPSVSDTPVYRVYDLWTGEHHYTASAAEQRSLVGSGRWRDEGVAWYSDDARTCAVYRVERHDRGPLQHHHYTISRDERDVCVGSWGWNDEGTGWYALAAK